MNIKKYIEAELALGSDLIVIAEETTDPELLEELSRYPNWKVRWYVANNGNTPLKVLISLSIEEDIYVKLRAIASLDSRYRCK